MLCQDVKDALTDYFGLPRGPRETLEYVSDNAKKVQGYLIRRDDIDKVFPCVEELIGSTSAFNLKAQQVTSKGKAQKGAAAWMCADHSGMSVKRNAMGRCIRNASGKSGTSFELLECFLYQENTNGTDLVVVHGENVHPFDLVVEFAHTHQYGFVKPWVAWV